MHKTKLSNVNFDLDADLPLRFRHRIYEPSFARDGGPTTGLYKLIGETDCTHFLSDLTNSQGPMTPSFSAYTTVYSISSTSRTFTVAATLPPNTAGGTTTLNGANALNSGTASSTLTAPTAGSVYSVTIEREAMCNAALKTTYRIDYTWTASSDATLSSLVASTGAMTPVTFSPATTEYTVVVPHSVTSLTLTPTAADAAYSGLTVDGVSVTSGSASGSLSLTVGDNVFDVVCTAQDLVTTVTYQVTVRRQNNVGTLSSLTLSVGVLVPVFDSSTTSYAVSLANAEGNVAATATTSDPTNVLTVVSFSGNTVASGVADAAVGPLVVGRTLYTVVVESEDGTVTTTYTVTITRASTSADFFCQPIFKSSLVFKTVTSPDVASCFYTVNADFEGYYGVLNGPEDGENTCLDASQYSSVPYVDARIATSLINDAKVAQLFTVLMEESSPANDEIPSDQR